MESDLMIHVKLSSTLLAVYLLILLEQETAMRNKSIKIMKKSFTLFHQLSFF